MNTSSNHETRDPLGLRNLPAVTPPEDGWRQIEAALQEPARSGAGSRGRTALLATAACVLLAALVVLKTQAPAPAIGPQEVATITQPGASSEQDQTLNDLIAMSQTLEKQLKGIRTHSGSIPASSAVYVAELEDMVAQVDTRLSVSPGSINLWGQRVNLLLDLAQIYQQQWEREYGRMASL
jgi:hypothetical protein